tara:strand:+ start:213 stop:1265 length:1053 start_codon:yes stop_codon:yes gene_type:complete
MTEETFDLYDREKKLLKEGESVFIKTDLNEIKFFAERLFDRFKNLVRENEDITKHSDRLEQKLFKLNKSLRNQTKELEVKKNKLEILSKQLGRYLPPQIHEAIFAGKYDTKITTKRKKLTVFFSDIKDFTRIAETLQPEALTEYLNEYFSEMTKIALSYGATIDKYIGDAVMLFFGDPDSNGVENDAKNCVKMALEMQDKLKILQRNWKERGFENPFKVRMGINTGYCNVGNFGSEQRLSYTIIGGEVNVAQRLESASDISGILISHETYVHVSDIVNVEERQSVRLKGIDREIRTYAIKGRKEELENKYKLSHNSGIFIDLMLDSLTDFEKKELSVELKKLLHSLEIKN